MDNRKLSTEFDDDEILNKLDTLLDRYKNQVEETNDLNEISSSSQAVSVPEVVVSKAEASFNDEIPTLTEIVMLKSVSIQARAERSLSLQQLLDAALDDAKIEMKTSDRIMLVKALKKRLT